MAKKSPPPKIYQRFMLVVHKKEFIAYVKKARVKCGLPEDGLPIEEIETYEGKVNVNRIDKELKKLSKKFRLGPMYQSSLATHFQFGVTKKRMFPNENVVVQVMRPTDEDDWPYIRLFIEILPDTSIEDIREAWDKVSKYQQDIFKKNPKERARKMPALERDIRIAMLRRENMPVDDVARTIKEEFPDMPVDTPHIAGIANTIEEKISRA